MKLRTSVSFYALAAGLALLSACATDRETTPSGEETIVVTGSTESSDDKSRSETSTPVAEVEAAPPTPPPPPPPPPSVRASPSPVASSTVTMSKRAAEAGGDRSGLSTDASVADEVSIMPEPMPPEPDAPPPPTQSGLLTAGDYDDVLNAKLYRDYASEFLQNQRGDLDLPDIDVTEAITIKVTGRNGEPLRGATVALTSGGQPMFNLKTSTAGTVQLFPQFDALPKDLTISVTGRGAIVKQLSYDDIMKRKTAGPVTVSLGEPNRAATEFDLMLVIDTTGSMGDELRYLQAELKDIVSSIESAHPSLDTRIGLTFYRDIGDQYIVRDFDFTSNIEELQANLAAQQAQGGGNYPEAMDQALEKAMAQSWRDDSIKAMMVLADAPPHDSNISKAWDQAILARPKGVHIVPVAASGVGDKAEFIMRAMAAVTQSRYIFLTDDSGIGNPHAEPDVDCYVVTRLDTMVQRVLSSLISGTRVEPGEAEIIRTVGNYNGGVCELDADGQERVVLTGGEN